MATGSRDNTVRIWDGTNGRPIGVPLRHQEAVDALAFDQNVRIIATGGRDQTARFWDIVMSKPIGPPLQHQGDVKAVRFSDDGGTLLTGSADAHIRNWEVPVPVRGDAERIVLWIDVVTGTELDDRGAVQPLDSVRWRGRRQLLDQLGGIPLP